MGYIVIAIGLLFSFAACTLKEKLPDMSIQEAQLTEEEKDIIDLLGVEDDGYIIYDFEVDGKIKAIQVNTYELKDGKWALISGDGGSKFEDIKGRIALSTDDIAKEVRIAIQGEKNRGSESYHTEVSKAQENMGRATSYLMDAEEIVYEQEIPLVVQIQTSKNSISSYGVEYFFKPEEYSQYGYEHVYAITVKFSEKNVGELNAAGDDLITTNQN